MTADGPAELMLPISFTAIKFAKVTARRNAGEFPMFGNDNLITMMDGYFNKGAHIYALTPMVEPGISDFEEDIRALGEHFRNYRMIQRVEILINMNH